MDGIIIHGPPLQGLSQSRNVLSKETDSPPEDILNIPIPPSQPTSNRNDTKGDADSTRTDLKRVIQAKKRLQAFCSAKLNSFNPNLTPAKTVSSPKALMINQAVYDEKGNKTESLVLAKKPPFKKGQNPSDRAKAVIKEIEEIKKQEYMESMRKHILTTTAINSEENRNDRLQCSEQDNQFKKHEIKYRNYRKSDFTNRSPTPEHHVSRKSQKKSNYPQNWDEFNSNSFNFVKMRELNKRKLERSGRHGTYNDYSQHLILKAPSHLIEPYKMITPSGKSTTIPFQHVRFTSTNPKISYKVNTNTIKEVYFTRNEIFKVIKSDFKDIILKLCDSKYHGKSKPAKNKSTREWFPKNWKGDNNECKLLEKSIGLSFLQNYSGEDDDEDEEVDDNITDAVKKDSTGEASIVDGNACADNDKFKHSDKENDIKITDDPIDTLKDKDAKDVTKNIDEEAVTPVNTTIDDEMRDLSNVEKRDSKENIFKLESDVESKTEKRDDTSPREIHLTVSEKLCITKEDDVEDENKSSYSEKKKKKKSKIPKKHKYESRKTEDIEKELLEIEEKLRQHKKRIKRKKKRADKSESSNDEIVEKKPKKKKKKEKSKKSMDEDDYESDDEKKEKPSKDKGKKLKNKKAKLKKNKKQHKTTEVKHKEDRSKKKSKSNTDDEKEITRKRKRKLRREKSPSSDSSSESEVEEVKTKSKKARRKSVKKANDCEESSVESVEEFKLEKSQEREVTPPTIKSSSKNIECTPRHVPTPEQEVDENLICSEVTKHRYHENKHEREYDYDSYDSASEYRIKEVKSKVHVFQSKPGTDNIFIEGRHKKCETEEKRSRNEVSEERGGSICSKKKKDEPRNERRKSKDDVIHIDKDRLKQKEKTKEKVYSKDVDKSDKSAKKYKSKDKEKPKSDYSHSALKEKPDTNNRHSFSSDRDADSSRKASDFESRKLSFDDFEPISPQDFEVHDNKTPDTDEYHSFWETEDEASPSVSSDKRRMNRSWESDEELFGRNTRAKDSDKSSYKTQKLEMPLHLDKFTRHTRGRWDQEARFSSYDDYPDTSTDLKLLELERETLNQEKQRLEIERKKIEQMELERFRELEQERLDELEQQRLRSINNEWNRELESSSKQRLREQEHKNRRSDVKMKEEKYEKERTKKQVTGSSQSHKTIANCDNVNKYQRKSEKRSSTPLFDLKKVKIEPDDDYSLDNSLVSVSSMDIISEKTSQKSVTPTVLENEYEEFIKAVGSDITTDKVVSNQEDCSATKVTSSDTLFPAGKELKQLSIKSRIEHIVRLSKSSPIEAASNLTKIHTESAKSSTLIDINLTLPENIPLPETKKQNTTVAPTPVPCPRITPCDTSLLPSTEQEFNNIVNKEQDKPSETDITASSETLTQATTDIPLPAEEVVVPKSSEMAVPDTSSVADEENSGQKRAFTFTGMTLPSKRLLLNNSALKLNDDSDNEDLTGKMIKKLDDLSATISELKKEKSLIEQPTEKQVPVPELSEETVRSKVSEPEKNEVTLKESSEKPTKVTKRKRSRSRSRSPYSNRKYEKDHRRSDVHRYSPQRNTRRSPSPRRYRSPLRRSPRRRRHPSPVRSPKRSRRSPLHRDKSPQKRSISPRPRRGSPLRESSHRDSPRRASQQERSHPMDMDRERTLKSPVRSPLQGTKRSVADSTISDDLLPQLNHDDLDSSSDNKLFGRPEGYRSPKRLSLDDRISQALGVKRQENKLLSEYHNYNYMQGYYDQYGQVVQYDVYSQPVTVKNEQQPVLNKPPPSKTNESQKKVSTSRVVQVGNVLEVVPTEDIQPFSSGVKQERPKLSAPKEEKPPAPVQKILQVGNMLQIVPTANLTSEVPKVPKIPAQPAPPKTVILPKPSIPDIPVELPPVTPSENIVEKPSAEELMKQKIAERRAERESRRAEREKRKKEKEKKRKEKEKQKQIKLKIKTEEIIKRALLMEIDEDNDDDSSQWPEVPIIITNQDGKEPGKSILLCEGFSRTSEDSKAASVSKCVKFADGIRPGEGTSPSGGEELSSPPPMPTVLPKEKRFKKTKIPKKSKKKKIKVKVIKRPPTEEEDESEEDILPPPPPPPGSPPPHLFPPRIKTHTVNNIKPSYVSDGNQSVSQPIGLASHGTSASHQPPLPSMVASQPPPPPAGNPPHASNIQPPLPTPPQSLNVSTYRSVLPANSQAYMCQTQENVNLMPSTSGGPPQPMRSVPHFLVQNPSLMGNTVPGSSLKMSDAMNQAIQATLNSTGGVRMLSHTLLGQMNGQSQNLQMSETSGVNVSAQVSNNGRTRAGNLDMSRSGGHSADRSYNRHNNSRSHRRGASPHRRQGGFGQHRRLLSESAGHSRGHTRPGQRSRDNPRHRKRF